jgi:Immunity protein 50
MTSEAILREIPGGDALFEWFGRAPLFHDAYLLEISLSTKRSSVMRLHTWEMTDRTDAKGYFILEKHVVVTVTFSEVMNIALSDFNLKGIVDRMHITKIDGDYEFAWDASYGVDGSIRAKQAHIGLTPGKP